MTRPENTGSAINEDGNQIEVNLPVQQEQPNSDLDDLAPINNNSKDLIFNSDNKTRLSLFRTCIALIPRLMPCFKENELVDILTRLTIHLDDELKLTSFQTLKILVSDYPNWRKFIFSGFTNFILKEISDMFPKLIENALKMLIQLLNTWKSSMTSNQNLDECCQILYHLEGFSLFTLCHSNNQRRKYGLLILKECKSIGESSKCFKLYPFHNYVVDVLDMASIHAMKQLHLQCFNSNLITSNTKPDLAYLIDQSSSWDSCINLSNFSENFSQTNSLPTQVKNQRAPSVSTTETTIEPVDTQTEPETGSTTSSAPSSLPNSFPTSFTVNFQNSPQISSQSQTVQNLNNIFTFDPWTECLAIFFSYDFIFTKCPQARVDAWPFIYTRLQQILPFVDPNEPHEVPRTSILFGVGSNSLEKQRKASEREINLNLWKNYLIGACCLTSGSDRYLYYQEYEKYLIKTNDENENLTSSQSNLLNPNTSAINVDFTIVESTSKFYANFGTATSLIKMIVPFLKCEALYFREVIIRGLGRINIEAQRDLIEELTPFIKETADFKRQEKIRRLKKKDWTRLALVRIFELMAEQKTLSKRVLDTFKTPSNNLHQAIQQQHTNDELQLRKTFNDFIEAMYVYLESEADKIYDHLNLIRLHFSMFVYKLVDSVPKERRGLILTDTFRQNLFNLVIKWSGRFYVTSKDSVKLNQTNQSKNLLIHQNHYHHLHCYHFYEELEIAATRACAAILYSGNVCDYFTNKNSIIFNWLNNLIEVANSEMRLYDNCKSQVSNEIYTLTLNCLIQLLDLSLYTITSSNVSNGNTINLSLNNSLIFEWAIDKSYSTLSQEIADLCFISLSKVYLDYLNQSKPVNLSKNNLLKSSFESIYMGPILTLILLNIGSNRLNIHETSVTLLRAVNKNFLQDNFETKLDSKSSTLSSVNNIDPINSFLNIDFDIINSLVLSSKSQAFISEYLAKKNPEQTMFVFCEITSHFESCTSNSLRRTMLNVLVPWFYNLELINPNVVSDVKKNTINNVLQLQSGYGSIEATHLILNNLFYLTCKFGDQFNTEFELLWATLASTWRSNLKIIYRYLTVMITFAPYEALSHGKKIICYLSRVCPDRIVDELVNELELIDTFNSADIMEKVENQFPFYKYNRPATVPVSPPPSPKPTHNHKKSSIYFVNQDDDDEDMDDESIEFVNQSDLTNLEDDEYDEDEDSDDSDSEYSESESEAEYYKNLKKTQSSMPQFKLNIDTNQLPLPPKFQSFACPLNKLLYHIGHHHNQQSVYTYQNQAPVYSYHNNYLHHNHYQHLNYLQRGSIALMLLTELVCNDGADFDWTQYLPILFHYCLINFDNTKQLVTEHAKKLFLDLLYILTVQNELYLLTDFIVESLNSVIDNQSIIFDRKYKGPDSDYLNGNCHYNFNFNPRVVHENQGISLKASTSRNLINIHSAPSSPAQVQNIQPNMSEKNKMKSSLKKNNKLIKAKDHLGVLLDILAKCKNGPVWPHELITPQNYSKQLKSVDIINDFVDNLKNFLAICLSTKQVSTISSTRSFSSPLNLATRFSNSNKSIQIDKKWSLFALNTSFSTSNRHFAGRSLQIYRALSIKINSLSMMSHFLHRLKDTIADTSEDFQGYVTEILLTLKMNASILVTEYLNSDNEKVPEPNAKHKSKSLKLRQEKSEAKKKYSTAIGSELSTNMKNIEEIKQKTATLSRKQVSQIMNKQPLELQRFVTKYKHQISYRKCLTLSLFNYKWQVLQDRVGTSILPNRKNSKFLSFINFEQAKGQNTAENYLKILVQIFWLSMCLLESDFEHEFNLACDILEQILSKIDLNGPVVNGVVQQKNEFRTNLELFAFRINWPNFPGLQNLILKGCTSQKLSEKSQNMLILLIPYCSKLNFVDPCGGSFYGLWGLSMNLLAMLPTMILNYESPTDICVKAADEYCKIIKEIASQLEEQGKLSPRGTSSQSTGGYQKTKIEQLKNLHLVIHLYGQKSFGKDKNQWTKCVITYMSEFFHLCQIEQSTITEDSASKTNFYFNWIVLLIEFLEKSTSTQYQSAVLTCLNSLLNFINFGDQSAWTFINEELLRVVSKFITNELWPEVMDLVKLTVGKSSSLLENDRKVDSPKFYLNESNSQVSKSQVPSSARSFSGKKELPGRTLDFDFDFSWFIPVQKTQSSPGLRKTQKSSTNLDQLNQLPPLNLMNLHSNKHFTFLNSYLNGSSSSGWKRPQACQNRTREKLFLMYNALNRNQSTHNLSQMNENSSSDSHKTSLQKSPSVIFENSLNSSEPQKSEFHLDDNEENMNLITNTTLNNSNISGTNSIASRLSKKDLSQTQSPNSTGSSEQSSKSSSTSANQTSSNNSFNQTSFVFSPEREIKKEDSPKVIKPKPIAPTLPEHVFNRTHTRANSMSINKSGSIINIIGSGLNTYSGKSRQVGPSMTNVTPGVSQHVINTFDDNNFINNTFSFLDDLESNAGDFVIQKVQQDEENKEKIEYENFPWHAILPAKDKEDESDQQKSQTLSVNSSTDGLSKSFSSTSDIKSQFPVSSKTKPMAPKIKGSATIGVSTGISTLKNLSLHKEDGEKSENQPGERRRSVTRIISSESLDKDAFKKDKTVVPQNSLQLLQTNLIYDHRADIDTEKSSESLNSLTNNSFHQQPIIRTTPMIKNTHLLSPNSLLKPKPNFSKLSSASNLNNPISPEDNQRTIALSLLADRSRSLSKSTIDNPSRSNSNSDRVKSTQHAEENQLKLEKTIKSIYQCCLPLINILNMNQDEIQRAWKLHIQNMLNTSKSRSSSSKLELSMDNLYDTSKNFNPIESFYLFKKLFNDARYRLNNLLSECYQYLTRETKLFLKLEKHLVIILDLINSKLDCPVVYYDQEWFMQLQEILQAASPNKSMSKSPLKINNFVTVSFIDNHKRILWEIGENYDTFVYIKHDVSESLDSIKKLEKNSTSSLHGSSEINSKIEKFFKKIDLSKKFCKLVSQFMILLQSYSKLLPNLTRNLSNITLTDLSTEMSNLKRSLMNASHELELNGRLSPMFPVNLENTLFSRSHPFKTILPNSKEMLIYWILESIRQENYTQTLEYYKIAQKNWPNDFNKNNQSGNELDFDLILIVACEHARQKSSNMIAIIEPEIDFVEISQNVLQEIIEITNLVNSIDIKFKENISSVLNDNDNEDDEADD